LSVLADFGERFPGSLTARASGGDAVVEFAHLSALLTLPHQIAFTELLPGDLLLVDAVAGVCFDRFDLEAVGSNATDATR